MALRVGILNIMPRMEEYEPLLLGPLARSGTDVEPVFVRLESHAYTSSDQQHLEKYVPFADAGRLDGLILTGAPVEELPFAEVRYFRELASILDVAHARIPSTLGLCWGGMALAHLVGIPKRVFDRKLFGVFEADALDAGSPLAPAPFRCAQSRHSGCDDAEVERAARDGRVRLIGGSRETGHTLFASPDHRFVMHLGHPEYVAERIAFEHRRDRDLGRTDVPAPRGFDPEHPSEPWADHREGFFRAWLRLVAATCAG